VEGLRQYPFVRLLIPFIIGIFLSQCLVMPVYFAIALPLLLLLVLLLLHVFPLKTPVWLFPALVYVFISTAAWSISSEKARTVTDIRLSEYSGQMMGEVVSEPVISEKSVRIVLAAEAIHVNGTWQQTKGNLQLYLPADSAAARLQPGDKLAFSPDLKQFENRGNPGEFDYKKYMWQQYIQYTDFLQTGEWKKLESQHHNSIERLAASMRNYVIRLYQSAGLQGDELGVATALTLGNKSYLSDEVRQAYSVSGGMHVLAVSGLHVGVFYLVISGLLAFIKNKKLLVAKTVFIVLTIWFYAMLTGLSASVVRAAIMFSLFSMARLMHRNSDSINVLAASAFIALCINPATLYQVGFLLSYAAVFSIVYFYPKIHIWWAPSSTILQKLWSLVAVSLAAQIGTLPFTTYYFNQFPTYFLLTNIALIPLVSVAIYLAIALTALSFIPYVSDALGWLFSKSVWLMNSAVQAIESLPFSSLSGLYINTFQFVLLLLLMATVILFIENRKFKMLAASMLIILVFSLTSVVLNIRSFNQTRFIVYNLKNTTAINLIDGRDNVLFVRMGDAKPRNPGSNFGAYWNSIRSDDARTVQLDDLRPEKLLSGIVAINNRHVFNKYGFFAFYNLRFFIPDERHTPIAPKPQTVAVHYVVYTETCCLSVEELKQYVDFETLIIDASLGRRRYEEVRNQALAAGINLFDVNNSGALVQTDLRKP